MRQLIDPHHPFFDKPVARWLTTLAPILWAGVEFYNRELVWGLLFLIAGLYAGYMLFIVRNADK